MRAKSRRGARTLLGLLLVFACFSPWAETGPGAWRLTRDIYYADPEAREKDYQCLDVSLVGTDETYLKQKGMSLADLKAVVAILYLTENDPSTVQTKAFAKELSQAGSEIILIPGNENTREAIDEEPGREGDTPTRALVTFIHAKI